MCMLSFLWGFHIFSYVKVDSVFDFLFYNFEVLYTHLVLYSYKGANLKYTSTLIMVAT